MDPILPQENGLLRASVKQIQFLFLGLQIQLPRKIFTIQSNFILKKDSCFSRSKKSASNLDEKDLKQLVGICNCWLTLSISDQIDFFHLLDEVLSQIQNLGDEEESYFQVRLAKAHYLLYWLQFSDALSLIQDLKRENKIRLCSLREVKIRLLYSQYFQVNFERAKALKQLYMADQIQQNGFANSTSILNDQLIRAFHPEVISLRNLYNELLMTINVQNKEIIFAHYLTSKQAIFAQHEIENLINILK